MHRRGLFEIVGGLVTMGFVASLGVQFAAVVGEPEAQAARAVNTGAACYGICCQYSPGSTAANGGAIAQCTPFAAMAQAGVPWPSDWVRVNDKMAASLGAGNYGCAQVQNAVLCDGGACLTAVSYDGGACPGNFDGGSAAPNGYGATTFNSTGVVPPITVTYLANIPAGTNSCEGGISNCLDVPIVTVYQTYSAGIGYFDGGGKSTLPPGFVSTWQMCGSPSSPYYGTGVCVGSPTFWPESPDFSENFEGVGDFSLFKAGTQIQHNNRAHISYGVMAKYYVTITPGVSMVAHYPDGFTDTISSADVSQANANFFIQMEMRTPPHFAGVYTAVVDSVVVCTPGNGGPCF